MESGETVGVGDRDRRRAVARSACVVGVLLLGRGGAAAQDAPSPPAPPAPESPPSAPRRDPEAEAALRRLAEFSPSPFAAGAKELRCTATLISDSPFRFGGRLSWRSDGGPQVEVSLPVPLFRPDAREKIDGGVRRTVLLPFLIPAAWNPGTIASYEATSARGDGGLKVTLTERGAPASLVLTLGKDGLPTRYRPEARDAALAIPESVMSLRFAERGAARVLSSVELASGADAVVTFEFSYFGDPVAAPLPRRIDRHVRGGKPEAYLLHDYVIDGTTVEGTSFAEAAAGRARSVDSDARKALARWDAAVAAPDPARIPVASCRLDYSTPNLRHRLRISWRHGAVERCEPEAHPDGQPETDAAAWGMARVATEAASEFLRPPSRQFVAFDASMTGSDPRELVLDAISKDTPVRRLRVRLDAAGLPLEAVQEYGDGGVPGTWRCEWGNFRDQRIAVSDTVVRGERRIVTKTSWYDVPGFPPLRRTVERTISGGSGEGTYVQRFTDWMIDGRPVPGTESASPARPPAPDAPK